MKKLIITLIVFALFAYCTTQQNKNEAEAEKTLYIEWFGENEMANNMVMSGMNHFNNIEFEKSFVFFEKSIALDSTLFASHAMLTAFSLPNSEEQEYHYNKAKELVSDKNVNSKLFVSLLDTKNKNGKRHILGLDNNKYDKWVTMHKNEPKGQFIKFWYSRGIEDIKEREKALLDLLEEFKTKNIDYGPILNMLGYHYAQNGDPEKAKEFFENYIKVRPNGYNAYDSMGEYYFNLKDYKKSKEYYMMALSKYPPANSAQNKIREIDAMK